MGELVTQARRRVFTGISVSLPADGLRSAILGQITVPFPAQDYCRDPIAWQKLLTGDCSKWDLTCPDFLPPTTAGDTSCMRVT
jgi:hypothetical protein